MFGDVAQKSSKNLQMGTPLLFIFFRISWDNVMRWNLSSRETGWYMEITLLILNKLYGKQVILLMSLDGSPRLIWLQRALSMKILHQYYCSQPPPVRIKLIRMSLWIRSTSRLVWVSLFGIMRGLFWLHEVPPEIF
jgi:hypothetical protein